MERKDDDPNRKKAGLAYPARYAWLGKVKLDTPARKTILVVGILILAALILLALLAR